MDPGPGVAGQQFTGIAARVLSRPSAVRGTDGRFHIVYELVLTDMTPFAVDVERVDVRAARTHRVLLSLAGRALSSRMNPVGGTPAGGKPAATTLLGSSGSAVIWLDVRVRRKADVPGALEHLVVSSTRPPAGTQSVRFSSLVGRVPLRSRAALVLGPPVRSGIWVADEGCCDIDTHHRRGLLTVDGNPVVPQRLAIDWMMLDRRHRAWVGDPARRSSYFSYGQPLIAAAAETVVIALDGLTDSPPPHDPPSPSLAGLTGNYVTLRVGPGIYLLYAHMKPGSVRVHVGERVRRRQLLGQLCNSGNSAPHTSISRSRSRAVSAATACRSSLTASSSWARSPSRSRTKTAACDPTASCALPQPARRAHATSRCRSTATSAISGRELDDEATGSAGSLCRGLVVPAPASGPRC